MQQSLTKWKLLQENEANLDNKCDMYRPNTVIPMYGNVHACESTNIILDILISTTNAFKCSAQ